MGLSRRERAIRTLEIEEVDKVPIFNLGFEKTGTAYQTWIEQDEIEEYVTIIPSIGDFTEQKFWNADAWTMDPFSKMKSTTLPSPPGHEDERLDLTGRLIKTGKAVGTGMNYSWYVGPYFTKKEILLEYWEKYGTPTEHIRDDEKYSYEKWSSYCEALNDVCFPFAGLPYAPHESLFEGMGLSASAYYMRKDPQFIHYVLDEYFNVNIEIIKRLSEAKVEVVMFSDDLGQKERSIFSKKRFEEFFLPKYKKLIDAAHKHGMLIVQHSCGYIDDFAPLLSDAGLNGLQALEPAAGVDLTKLKETIGDKTALLGGMDSSRVMSFGTPQDVVEDVKKCIRIAAPGGGYFAGPSHNILDVPYENVLALRDAIEKYRNYPLKFD